MPVARRIIWPSAVLRTTSSSTPVPSPAAPTSARRKRVYALTSGIAVAIVVLVLILTGIIPLVPGAAKGVAKVTVTQANLAFLPYGNPCLGNYTDSTSVTLAVGGEEVFYGNLTDQSPSSAHDCGVGSIQILTPGFSLVSSNTPLTVPTSGTVELTFTVRFPATPYNGTLNMSAPVTYLGPNIHVTSQEFLWSASPSYCGVEDLMGSGSVNITGFAGGTYNDSVGFFVISPEYNCIINSVGTVTPGFSVLSSSTPYMLPIDSIAGISFVIQFPLQAYTGGLNITLDLTIEAG